MPQNQEIYRDNGFVVTLEMTITETVQVERGSPKTRLVDVDVGYYSSIKVVRADAKTPAIGTFTFSIRDFVTIPITDAELPFSQIFTRQIDFGPNSEPLRLRKQWNRGPR